MKNHTSHTTRVRKVLALLSALPFGTLPLLSQTAATSGSAPANNTRTTPVSSASADESEDVVVLDPFSVITENEGYKATDTLGGARVRTKLADTPSSISVITPKLLQDLGITNGQELYNYTLNTEVAGMNGGFSGVTTRGFGAVGAAEGDRLANPVGANRARGLSAMDGTRNYFISDIPGDSFNISRWEIARGPNSFLFGVGSPSGIANVSTNEANYKNAGALEGHIGSFGTSRQSIDYNRVLIPNQLAFRIDAVNDDTQYQQKPAFSHSKRIYAAMRIDPKVLDTNWARTKIQANYEHGSVSSNNPRELPPLDYLTGYFQNMPKGGYDPFVYSNTGGPNFDPRTSPWSSNADIHYAWGNAATYWWDAATGNLQRVAQAGAGGTGAPTGLGNNGGGFTGNGYNVYTAGYSQFARATDFLYRGSFPGAYDKTVNYIDKTLADTSVFDFYNKLIDGPNKHEWQDWDAFNVSLVQSFFDNKLTFQVVADHQEYKRGQDGLLMGYIAPYISVDLNSQLLTYPTSSSQAQANPNVGRPFIGSDASGGSNETKYTRDNYQLTGAYSLDFADYLGKSTAANILGHHELTGLAGRYTTSRDKRVWNMYAADPLFAQAQGITELTLANRNINWVAYLGPTLRNRSSAAGANLDNMSNLLVPGSGPVRIWNNTWTAGTSVSPTAAWVYQRPTGYRSTDVETITSTQAANPANYAGYVQMPIRILSAKNDKDQLYTSGNLAEETITSTAFMYQGYFWDETVIPQFGVRRDKVRQRGNQAPIYGATGIASMNYRLTDAGVELETTSKSYGITVHLPKSVKKNLPAGTDVTLFYFRGANETPRVRYGIDGTMLPNESGRTDDYGVQLDGFDGRASMRFTVFKTKNKAAQASYGQPLGAAGWMIDSLPSWTLTMAAGGVAASRLPTGTAPSGMEGADWYWGWGQSNPALATRIATAIHQNFPTLFPQSYWDQYGLPINMGAVQSGDWMHVVSNGTAPFAWNVNNTHQIHGTTPIIDQNIVSKGYELETTVKPLKGWDLTFNASKVNAYQTSLGEAADTYLNGMARIFLGTDVGLTPIWGNSTDNARVQFLQNIWAPYLTQVALTGTDQPELRKWNFRGVSTYTFSQGPLNGFRVGGAYRWASKPVLGYGVKQTELFGNTAYIADVNKPLKGEMDSHVDLWVGYQRKLSAKLDWSVQINLRNVGERPHLTPISVEPDGTWAQQRIVSGMTFDVSTKFMF